MAKIFSSTGVTTGTYSDRLAVASPYLGQQFYQTDTDEMLKYATDLDTQNRWMQANNDYNRNFVVNGSFNVWQRATSFNPTSATTTTGLNYGADRWQMLQATTNGATAAYTRTAITSTDPAGYNYYCRVQRTSAQTFTTVYTLQTSFESQNIQAVRGKYVTLSFWARAGANYSAASSYLVSNIVTGTGTDNTVGNFTTNTVNTTTNNVLTTSWKRFSITTSVAIATTITQLGISFVFTPVGTAGAADYYDITGVQLEVGSAPSDFEFEPIQQTLAKCQRYYYTQTGIRNTVYCDNISGVTITFPFPVTMRAVPTTSTSSIGTQIAGSNNSWGAATVGGIQSSTSKATAGAFVGGFGSTSDATIIAVAEL